MQPALKRAVSAGWLGPVLFLAPANRIGIGAGPLALAISGTVTMHQVSVVMVRCPTTGRELSTGIEMVAATAPWLRQAFREDYVLH